MVPLLGEPVHVRPAGVGQTEGFIPAMSPRGIRRAQRGPDAEAMVSTSMSTAPASPPAAIPAGLRMTGIVKSFGAQEVLRGLNLTARPGRVYALLGPNGAGKSTTLAIALGLMRADSGAGLS